MVPNSLSMGYTTVTTLTIRHSNHPDVDHQKDSYQTKIILVKVHIFTILLKTCLLTRLNVSTTFSYKQYCTP